MNLLEKWRNDWWCKTSTLYPHAQLISFRRIDILGIYENLKSYFGLEHFEPIHLHQCKYEDLDLVRCLLADSTEISNFRIFEIINAILYTERKNSVLAQKLKATLKDPRQFMDLVFESEVNRILDENGFSIRHNMIIGTQQLDGYLEFMDQEYIVECKKVYNLKYELIRTLWSILFKMLSKIEKMDKGFGLYGYFTIAEISMKKSVHILNRIISQFFKQLQERKKYYIRSQHDGLNWATFPYHEKEYLAKLTENDWSFLFRLKPPDRIIPGINRYHAEIRFQYRIDLEDAHTKLFRIISKAEKQHKNNRRKPLLIFLDFESNRSLMNPLFSSLENLHYERIKRRLSKNSSDVILCFFFRSYTSITPEKIVKVICDDKFYLLKRQLETMNLNDSFIINRVC